MYKFRPYQETAVKKGVEFLTNPKEKQGAIEILPTGSGKSLVIAGIAKELNEPVLVFQPTKEILEQNYAKLRSYDIECSIYSASLNKKEVSNITFATIGTASNSILKFEDFKYLLIDECHRVNPKEGMYSDFLSLIGEKFLGFTATPYRLATNSLGSELRFITRTKPKVFSKVVHLTQISELYADGFLSPLEYFNIKGFDRKQVKINNTGADFSEKSLFDYCQVIDFPHKVYDITNRLLQYGRKNILVFTSFVNEAQQLADSLGDQAAIVTGKTAKKDRELILERFKGGEIKTVFNVGVLTTGFDFPELETIVLARPTMSLALYYQMVGRGIRISPNKKSCYVVDLCDNVKKFGKVETLTVKEDKPGLWYVENNGVQLTNKTFDNPFKNVVVEKVNKAEAEGILYWQCECGHKLPNLVYYAARFDYKCQKCQSVKVSRYKAIKK